MKKALLLLLFCSIFACEKVFIEKDPENTLIENFEIFWQEFDKHYAHFEVKQLDWDSVYRVNKSLVEGFDNSKQLYDLFEQIIHDLEDSHVNLWTSNQVISFDYTEGFSENKPEFVANYIENINRQSRLTYADVSNTNLGYMLINSFSGNESNFELIDEILSEFENKDGIIIDVRSNGGGSDLNSNIIASRFTQEKLLYKKVKYRNGLAHSDFTKWRDVFIEPVGNSFTKPVVLLTNRACLSATEDFISSMMVSPHVQSVGGTTGGGSGNPIFRELPNGWTFRVPTWLVNYSAYGIVEGVGMIPNFRVTITEEDILNEKDPILEKAIELLD